MSSVTEFSYIGIHSQHLEGWKSFAIKMLGMQIGEHAESWLSLRMDDKRYRLFIERGDREDLAFSGFSCSSSDDFNCILDRLRKTGNRVDRGDQSLAALRGVARLAATTDPIGNRVELVLGFEDAAEPFHSEVLKSRFVTGVGGLGHEFLMDQGKRDELLAWYQLLGFRISDYIREDIAPGVIADAVFMHCNARHHSVAWANMPFPKRLHHLMIEVADVHDVGLAYERCMNAGREFEMTLGGHPNDEMFSFYVRTPSGFNVEYGYGGRLIDDANWTVRQYDHLNTWGHRAPEAEIKRLGTHSAC